jgi:alkyldihydroxyacetonephosphate synthase
MRPDILDELRSCLGEGAVVTDPTERALRAYDFWPRLAFARRRGEHLHTPGVVVQPTSRDEVAAVLRTANRFGVPVVPYGAGTGVCGGATAVADAITLDMMRMNRVVDLDPVSGTVTVEPGVIAQALDDHLRHRGHRLGHEPSSMHCSTIGGFLAVRSSGQSSVGFGKLEDQVVGLEAVLADGTVVEQRAVPASAAGPDLKRLFIGGEGTTGVITQATLRIHRAPERVLDRGVLVPDVRTGMDALREVMWSGVRPTVFRLYDEADTALVFGNQGMEVPEGCLIVFAVEGGETVARFIHDHVLELLLAAGGEDLGAGPGEHWREHRHDVSYRFAEYVKPHGTFGDAVVLDTMEVAALWSRLPDLYTAVRDALDAHSDLVLAHVSHAYPEGASIYFTFGAAPQLTGGDGRPVEELEDASLERYQAAWDAGQRAALDIGGTITHHHGIGLSRAPWLARELGAGGTQALRRVKYALDPAGVLNPGTLGLGDPSGRGVVGASPVAVGPGEEGW